MGGKGGGGGGGGWQTVDQVVADPVLAQQKRDEINAMEKNDPDYFAGTYGPNGNYRETYLKLFPEQPAPAAKLDEALTPPPETPAPAPEPEVAKPDPAPTTPAPNPIDPGGAIDQPTGDVLGGSILNPPKYWVGGIDSYKKGPSTKSSSLTTTQT